MHMTIRVITYAETVEDGHKEAIGILQSLCENQYPFDYYNVGNTIKANSEDGKKLIENGMDRTWRDFEADMKSIREMLSIMSDEDIFKERLQPNAPKPQHFMPSLARHYFHSAGQYKGSQVWLYDPEGEGIRDRVHLANVLHKWSNQYKGKSNPYKDMKIWVTPSDVHY